MTHTNPVAAAFAQLTWPKIQGTIRRKKGNFQSWFPGPVHLNFGSASEK